MRNFCALTLVSLVLIRFMFMVFNATFNNSSVISWWSLVLNILPVVFHHNTKVIFKFYYSFFFSVSEFHVPVYPEINWKIGRFMFFIAQTSESKVLNNFSTMVLTTIHSLGLVLAIMFCMVLELCPLINWKMTIFFVLVLSLYFSLIRPAES